MKRIKTFLPVILIATAMAATVTSCNKGPKPEETAIGFLNAYLSTDYPTAASFCTKEPSEFFNESVQDFENLTDSVKSIIKRQTAYFTPQIDSVSKYGKDTLLVSYTIVKNDPADSIATKGADQLIKSCLSIVKEDEDWKIAALNRL